MISYRIVWAIVIAQAVWLPVLNGLKCYYDEQSAASFTSPILRRPDSYFGYAITYDETRKSLVISSPKEDDVGKIYDCNIANVKCDQIKLESEPTRKNDTYSHDYWLGATLGAGDKFIMACAPLTLQKKGNIFFTGGTCYVRYDEENKLKALPQMNVWSKQEELKHSQFNITNELTTDTFGWSMDISTSTAVIGGPAMFKGRVMVYKQIIKGGTNTPRLLQREFNSTLPEFNLGYSVASGMFRSDKTKYYAVGSPYGPEGSGSVHFLTLESDFRVAIENELEAQIMKPPSIEKAGSMFGAALCAPKLRGLYNDLLVGAPAYAPDQGYSRGAVHVYLAFANGSEFPQYYRTIYGQEDGSRFGSAIISVGDLNVDDRDEIAIAAPFENEGRGAVYLYSGNEITKGSLKCLQKIQSPGYMSFGMSLASLKNFYGQACNELAIGAPFNDTVVVYKCFSSINVELKVKFPNLRTPRNGTTNSTFLITLDVEFPVDFQDRYKYTLETRAQLRHPNATLANPNNGSDYVFYTQVKSDKTHYVQQVHFILPQDGNYGMKIDYTVTSKLLNEPKCGQNNTSFLQISPQSVLRVENSVLAAECLSDCIPNITLNFINVPKSPYRVGMSDTEQLQVLILNTGDVAYKACVSLTVRGATVRKEPQYCEPQQSDADDVTLRCAPVYPIYTNRTWLSGSIDLYMGDLTNENHNIQITAELFDDCTSSNSVSYPVNIALDSAPHSVTLIGMSINGYSITTSRNQLKESGKVIEHTYTITNNATSNWVHIKCVFVLETRPYIEYFDPIMYTEEKQDKGTKDLECSDTIISDTQTRRTCVIGKLSNVYPTHLTLPIKLKADNMDEDTFNVTSNLELLLSDDNVISESVQTVINLESVPIWIIVLAILIGLILLFIIGFCMYECGFLRRDKKKDLIALKKSIRRQTIIRHSMRQSTSQRESADTPEENVQLSTANLIETQGQAIDSNVAACDVEADATGKKND